MTRFKIIENVYKLVNIPRKIIEIDCETRIQRKYLRLTKLYLEASKLDLA